MTDVIDFLEDLSPRAAANAAEMLLGLGDSEQRLFASANAKDKSSDDLNGRWLAIAGKPLEVDEDGRDQLLSPRILCCNSCAEEIEEIASLLRSFLPVRRRSRK